MCKNFTIYKNFVCVCVCVQKIFEKNKMFRFWRFPRNFTLYSMSLKICKDK